MSFKVTIRTDDGEVLDELECDCISAAVHVSDSEDYQGMFYADCDATTALHTLRTAMQTIADHLGDDDIAEAAQEDSAQLVEETSNKLN